MNQVKHICEAMNYVKYFHSLKNKHDSFGRNTGLYYYKPVSPITEFIHILKYNTIIVVCSKQIKLRN